MTREEILEYFKDINHAYNDCTRYDTLKRMIDELQEPCTDAISRQAVHIELEKWITYGEYKYSNATKYLYDRIDRLPPVTAEKVGHWIDHQDDRWIYAKCSECGTVHDSRTNYCPNCGSRMMQEVKHDD